MSLPQRRQRFEEHLAVPDVELLAVVDLAGVAGEVGLDGRGTRCPSRGVVQPRTSEDAVSDTVSDPPVGEAVARFLPARAIFVSAASVVVGTASVSCVD